MFNLASKSREMNLTSSVLKLRLSQSRSFVSGVGVGPGTSLCTRSALVRSRFALPKLDLWASLIETSIITETFDFTDKNTK